ncbi:Gamma-butyrobetaine,2-oxoglutarate dioxygenase [Novosphingobium nitrogenifigens DSM 19370]|uniref:trimethyllysine dioxygenase n=1 Tax=Novosphingobium nitrogenifigens DSM 19370 TaxID=983920 RepID=F1ZAM2_9SPHN|nr:TauD/TfdA family dioxygenase [Novosphingobium nitrogenifigens]EGD58341.1 Gamma-butyrobetaine,2-oxoglutarate dioxygenase [Novosphingobium nitrogenifigens DSM 19370]
MSASLFLDPVVLHDNGLDVTLDDGRLAYFNYHWLRDNCASSFDPETRERVFDIFAEAQAPHPAQVECDGNALHVTWAGSGHRSTYALSWLAAHADARPRHDPAILPRRHWLSDHYPAMARFAFDAIRSDRAALKSWVHALLTEGIAIVTGVPNSDEALPQTASLIGFPRPTFFGLYFDVRLHVDPDNLAYTAKALELHTDVPAEDLPPGVQFLHCRRNSVEGGESLFVDGAAVAAELRRTHPDDFRLLCETTVPFYNEHDRYDMRARQRVIELDDQGDISGVTISQHMADVFDHDQRFLDRYYPAFCRFGKLLQDERFLMRFRLNAGECIVFDNHRIVHARAAFVAESGERHLRGTYTDRGELRSMWRILSGEGRFKA